MELGHLVKTLEDPGKAKPETSKKEGRGTTPRPFLIPAMAAEEPLASGKRQQAHLPNSPATTHSITTQTVHTIKGPPWRMAVIKTTATIDQ